MDWTFQPLDIMKNLFWDNLSMTTEETGRKQGQVDYLKKKMSESQIITDLHRFRRLREECCFLFFLSVLAPTFRVGVSSAKLLRRQSESIISASCKDLFGG